MQRLSKVVPTNKVCVCASLLQREETIDDKEDAEDHQNSKDADDLIEKPIDVYSMVQSACQVSEIQYIYPVESAPGKYFIHLFVDDIAFQFIERLPKDTFINEEDPVVKKMLDRIMHQITKSMGFSRAAKDVIDKRQFALVIATHLHLAWTLIWVKFTNVDRFAYAYQIDCKPRFIGELSYNLRLFLELLVRRILEVDSETDMILQYQYVMPQLESEEHSNDQLLVSDIGNILKGYQENGFNIDETNIHFSEIADLDLLKTSKREKESKSLALLVKKRGRPRTKGMNSIEEMDISVPETQVTRRGPGRPRSRKNKRRKMVQEIVEDGINPLSRNAHRVKTRGKTKKNTEVEPSNITRRLLRRSAEALYPGYVTYKNLEEIKKQIPYDSVKLQQLVDNFKITYEKIQRRFYSRWAGSTVDEDKENLKMTSQVFPMYGPTQVEFEILLRHQVVTTKNLMAKLTGLGINPTKSEMRSISNARRWINQRFRYDTHRKCVYYLRNPKVVIPDYNDVPYIVMATHLHYNCCDAFTTHNLLKSCWYISHKCVNYIISQCSQCKEGTQEHKQ